MYYAREREMYPDVMEWLEVFIGSRFKRNQVIVRDTSRQPLNRALEYEGLIPENKPEWPTYDIRVDLTAFIISGACIEFAFVECKNRPITLRDISQLLGYSRVALPIFSCVVSPHGMGADVASLLQVYKRHDILEYYWPSGGLARSLVVATWDARRRSIDYGSVLPPGYSVR